MDELIRRRVMVAAILIVVASLLLTLACSGKDGKPQLAKQSKTVLRRGPDGSFPRFLIEGWTVTASDEQNEPKFDDPAKRFHHFEAKLSRGSAELNVTMYEHDAAGHERYFKQRVQESEEEEHGTVFGHPATIIKFPSGGGYGALWFADGISYELDLYAGTRDQFFDAVDALRVVAEDQWEAALPETSVRSNARSHEVDRMLVGIPQPPDFTADDLRRGPAINRNSLGIEVTKRVACGWIESWSAARRAGNTAVEKAAVDAMGTSRQWPVLLDIQSPLTYSKDFWAYADAMAGDGRMGVLPVEQSAVNLLNCRLKG